MLVRTYQHIEDAWQNGILQWCQAASNFALAGGKPWLLTANATQAQWIKSKLLAQGISLFGITWITSVCGLREALSHHFGILSEPWSHETQQFYLKNALLKNDLTKGNHASAYLNASTDLANAGWLGNQWQENGFGVRQLTDPILSWYCPDLLDALHDMISRKVWTPAIDDLLQHAQANQDFETPFSLCVVGWDVQFLPYWNLLNAALKATTSTSLVYLPAPRSGGAESLRAQWIESIALKHQVEVETCPNANSPDNGWSQLIMRLEGVDLDLTSGSKSEQDASPTSPSPSMLVGQNRYDQVMLGRDFVIQWLKKTSHLPFAKLAVLFPVNSPSYLEFVRMLESDEIFFEDTIGQSSEPALLWQIQKAILDYYLDETGIEPLLTLVGLLNDHPESFLPSPNHFNLPLDSVVLRQVLADAFTELQHRNARLLSGGSLAFERAQLAGPLKNLIHHLGHWPKTIAWSCAIEKWENCLKGFGIDVQCLNPLWSQILTWWPDGDACFSPSISSQAFLEYLKESVSNLSHSTKHFSNYHRPFARIVLTELSQIVAQTWHSVLFFDANEGIWPLYAQENSLLDDHLRKELNSKKDLNGCQWLLTSIDRMRLEEVRFYELLEHTDTEGEVAFASMYLDPKDPTKTLLPNEWSIRCWMEANQTDVRSLLDQWKKSVKHSERTVSKVSRSEGEHLAQIFEQRRNPNLPFDEYLFNFQDLQQDENYIQLQFESLDSSAELTSNSKSKENRSWWTPYQLQMIMDNPATMALQLLFGVRSWRETQVWNRGEARTIGRLVHRWFREALCGNFSSNGGSTHFEQLTPHRLEYALSEGLSLARNKESFLIKKALIQSGLLASENSSIPIWWQSIFAKTTWAVKECLESLGDKIKQIETSQSGAPWFCTQQTFKSQLQTELGPLRLKSRVDLVLLNQPEWNSQTKFHLINVKTGSAPNSTTSKKVELRSMLDLLLASDLGADVKGSSYGILHPETSFWKSIENSDELTSAEVTQSLHYFAKRQQKFAFGVGKMDASNARVGTTPSENLPLATIPIDHKILMKKAEVSQ